MFTSVFWRDAGERAVATFVQTLAAVIGVEAVDLASVNWGVALATSATATLLSVLKSVSVRGVGVPGTASATSAVVPAPAPERPVVTVSKGAVRIDAGVLAGAAREELQRVLRR